MTCEQVQQLIHPYIDADLSLLRKLALEAHIGECEICRPEYHRHLHLHTLVQAEAQYFAAPEILRKRIELLTKTTNTVCVYCPAVPPCD